MSLLKDDELYQVSNLLYLQIWLEEMTMFWKSCGNRSAWESHFVSKFCFILAGFALIGREELNIILQCEIFWVNTQ